MTEFTQSETNRKTYRGKPVKYWSIHSKAKSASIANRSSIRLQARRASECIKQILKKMHSLARFDVAQFHSKQSTSFEFCGVIQNTKRYQYKLAAQASASPRKYTRLRVELVLAQLQNLRRQLVS